MENCVDVNAVIERRKELYDAREDLRKALSVATKKGDNEQAEILRNALTLVEDELEETRKIVVEQTFGKDKCDQPGQMGE